MSDENKKPEEGKEEDKKPEEGKKDDNPLKADSQPQQRMREVVIQTDGSVVKVMKAEVSNLEMRSILSILLQEMSK